VSEWKEGEEESQHRALMVRPSKRYPGASVYRALCRAVWQGSARMKDIKREAAAAGRAVKPR
jgi:hypothetical protein